MAYFVYANGTALTSAEVEKMLSVPEHYVVLGQLGLKNIVCMQLLILKYCQGVLPIVNCLHISVEPYFWNGDSKW